MSADYDDFAWIYNRHWQRFTTEAVAVLERVLFPNLRPGERILDLCCGTGWLAGFLDHQGYDVIGLDVSGAMLRFARQNAPGVSLLQADARAFALARPVHAVVSTYNSLNHILEYEELVTVFSNVHAALLDGGWFVFELNTERKFRTSWSSSFGIVEDDHACIVRAGYEPDARLARFDATLFRHEGDDAWRRTDLTIRERAYGEGEIRTALETAGFAEIRAYGWNAGHAPEPQADRVWVLCRKRRSAIDARDPG